MRGQNRGKENAMSYGIIHMQKFKSESVTGIQIHCHRERNSRSNPDIHTDRSGQNYDLVECSSFREAIAQRVAALETKKAVRKDAVLMCGFVITSDRAFFDSINIVQEKEFFKDAVEFVKNRYGSDNVISATVHKDEKTPHLHVYITPIKNGKLSAKSIFDRNELASLQTDFFQSVGQKYKLDRGEEREVKRRHIKTEIFKTITSKAAQKYITTNDLENKILEKTFFSTTKETNMHVANRINSEIIGPLASELAKEKSDNREKDRKILYYKEDAQKYNELTRGLSRQNIYKLQWTAKKLHEQELEERKQRELEQRMARSRGRGGR